jgi:hypothetical protein
MQGVIETIRYLCGFLFFHKCGKWFSCSFFSVHFLAQYLKGEPETRCSRKKRGAHWLKAPSQQKSALAGKHHPSRKRHQNQQKSTPTEKHHPSRKRHQPQQKITPSGKHHPSRKRHQPQHESTTPAGKGTSPSKKSPQQENTIPAGKGTSPSRKAPLQKEKGCTLDEGTIPHR